MSIKLNEIPIIVDKATYSNQVLSYSKLQDKMEQNPSQISPSSSNRFQRQSSINSDFQRYQIKQQIRKSRQLQSKSKIKKSQYHKQKKSKLSNKPSSNKIQAKVSKEELQQLNSLKKLQVQMNISKNVSVQNQNKENQFPQKQGNLSSATTLQSYKDWKVYKNKSDLNMLPFPYCFDQSFQYKKHVNGGPLSLLSTGKKKNTNISQRQNISSLSNSPKIPKFISPLYKLKISNRLQSRTSNINQSKAYRPYFNFEKTPINQYLSYDISEQINSGLRQVQIMAQQIRRIKKQKKMATIDEQVKKQKYKGIRIRKSFVKSMKGVERAEDTIIIK